jgi:hypothetical protein
MIITRRSPVTGNINNLDLPITQEELDMWKAGSLIQNVFPYLSDDEREFLMTGLMPDDWEHLFPNRDEDE